MSTYVIKVRDRDIYTMVDNEPMTTNSIDMALVFAKDLSARFTGIFYRVHKLAGDTTVPVGAGGYVSGGYVSGRCILDGDAEF